MKNIEDTGVQQQSAFCIQNVISEFINTGKTKTEREFIRTLILSILAGAFIAFGAYSSLLVRIGIAPGLGKFLAGIVFSTGLIMITFTGAELFTGNILITMALFKKKVNFLNMLKNWSIVWFGNLIGALLIAILVIFNTNHAVDYLNLVHTTALNKVNLTPLNCFISGILCNTLVCLAVYTAQCAKSAAGKILGIVFPITTFIIAGYEHSVANMFFIPSGIMVQNLLDDISAQITFTAFLHNIIPVSLGNIAGAIIFVAAPLIAGHFKGCEK